MMVSGGIGLMTDPTYYPEWFYYPSRTRPPDWVHEFLEVVAAARPLIDSATVDGLTSDKVLAHLRPPTRHQQQRRNPRPRPIRQLTSTNHHQQAAGRPAQRRTR
jgi:hypothetical protein